MVASCCSFENPRREKSVEMSRRRPSVQGSPDTPLRVVGLQGVLVLLLLSHVACSRPSPHQEKEGESSLADANTGQRLWTVSDGLPESGRRGTSLSLRGCQNRTVSGECASYTYELQIWPNATIPYTITSHGDFVDKELYMSKVRQAMDWWENATCVQFIHIDSNTIHSSPGLPLDIQLWNASVQCTSAIGYNKDTLNGINLNIARLSLPCLCSVGNIAHELGHILSLLHEHNRYDRDSFIAVDFDNLLPDSTSNYLKDTVDYDLWGTPYDLGSIMHYPPYSSDGQNESRPVFTLNGDIVFNGTVGQRECLSYYDIIMANNIYQCNTTEPPKTSCNYQPVDRVSPSQLGPSTPQLHHNFIYPGDTVAFKSLLSPLNRWIGCTEIESSRCFAWGCPGSKFNIISPTQCWEYKFVVSPVEVVSTATSLRFNDTVVLQQCRRGESSTTTNCSSSYAPLRCPGTGEQCFVDTSPSCLSDSRNHTLATVGGRCRRQVFRLASPDGEGRRLRHKDHVVLVGEESAAPLVCCVENRRKRKRTCKLSPLTSSDETCQGAQYHFQIYKL